MLHIIRVFNTFILSYSYTLNFSWESITHDKTKRENQIDFFFKNLPQPICSNYDVIFYFYS